MNGDGGRLRVKVLDLSFAQALVVANGMMVGQAWVPSIMGLKVDPN